MTEKKKTRKKATKKKVEKKIEEPKILDFMTSEDLERMNRLAAEMANAQLDMALHEQQEVNKRQLVEMIKKDLKLAEIDVDYAKRIKERKHNQYIESSKKRNNFIMQIKEKYGLVLKDGRFEYDAESGEIIRF